MTSPTTDPFASPGTAVATTDAAGGSLRIDPHQTEWTPVQLAALSRVMGTADAPSGELQVFLHVCQRTQLDPFRRQVYLLATDDPASPTGVSWRVQTGIDGFRLVSERHEQYAGPLGPEWCGPDGQWRDVWTDPETPPVAARFGVTRRDWTLPAWGVAHFAEYAERNDEGRAFGTWRKRPAGQLAKCAEALARRTAFPDALAGVYTDDEMAHTRVQVDNTDRMVFDQAPNVTPTGPEPAGGPDWDAMVPVMTEANDASGLDGLLKMARALEPNNMRVLDLIAQAQEEVLERLTAPDPQPAAPAPAQDDQP